MPVEFKDYYATLGVTKAASEVQIKTAYRKLARQHHPDLNPGNKAAESRFKDINEANEVLGNAESRRKYDELGTNWRNVDPVGEQHGSPHARRRSRTVTPNEMSDIFGEGVPSSDFFSTFFGGTEAGPRGRRQARPQRGRDIEQLLDLTLEETFGGTSRHLKVERKGQPHTVEVRIPAGVKDGSRVKVRNEGEPGGTELPSGDLHLVVRQLPHATFDRRGQDLHTRLTVPVTTAVLGGDVAVPTLAGSSIKLRVPELTPAGRTFRLRGHGMPDVRDPGTRGDLFVAVDIQIPTTLSPEAKEHYQALEKLADSS